MSMVPLTYADACRGSPKKDSAMKGITNGGEAPYRTVAELAREKKLREDPLADVHGPLFVTCKRCGSRIKLSPKSSYDPFHWTKHRERCLRKPLGVTRAARRSPKESYTSPSKKSPASSSITDGDNVTPPPLTPDDDRSGTSDVFKDRSTSPNINDIDLLSKTVVRELDSALLDYLQRSQHSLPKTFPLVERWQTWNWSELRPPKWIADTNPVLSEDQDEHDDDWDEPLTEHAEEYSITPKLTLHPGLRPQGNPSPPT
ncbi:hypothetical protein F5I97DRAFT_1923352 [Phlebopus sp. FC_14]|nr:hypothetical protein F5I97DRAFT_1923352 [Phlebopus sp. FC_14]